MSVNGPHGEPTGARLLVVDDEPAMIRTLRTNLRGHNFQVETAENAAEAKASYDRRAPDLILLDLNLPDGDGFEVVRHIRERSGTPIIVLSARGGERDKVNALDLGADDYITKPFDPEELLARVRAVLRRARPSISRIRLGKMTVDFLKKHASIGNRGIPFTHREFELLSYLAEHRDMVVRRSELLRAVWGYLDTDISTRTVDFAVARLRRKVEVDHHHPQFIRTAHGDGYCLTGVSDESTAKRRPG